MIGMIRVQRMFRAVGVFRFSALVMVAVVMVPVFAVLVLVTVMPLAVMNVLWGILIYRGRWCGWCRARHGDSFLYQQTTTAHAWPVRDRSAYPPLVSPACKV